MVFRILSLKGSEITDPDTGDLLGSVELEKSRVKVTMVYERVSVAETYRTHKINVGGKGLSGAAFASLFAPPKWETRVETFEIDEDTKVELDEEEAYVKRGDPVIQHIAAPPPTQPSNQVSHIPVALDPIAVRAQQLQIVRVVRPAPRLRHHVVNLHYLEQKLRLAPPAHPLLPAKQHVLLLPVRDRGLDIRAPRNVRPSRDQPIVEQTSHELPQPHYRAGVKPLQLVNSAVDLHFKWRTRML